MASAGLTEKIALKEGFEVVIGKAESVDKHSGAMPDANKIKIKFLSSILLSIF